MGYTNTTSHYSLPQYVATDKPKYLTDFNQTMEAIDTQMYTNAQAAATADSKAVTAKDTADGAVSSIGVLNTQINGDVSDPSDRGLAGDVSDNSGAINTINSLIGNGEPTTTDKTIIGAINEIYADITGTGTAVTAANVSYDNTLSGLSATNVEAAIDEVLGDIPANAAALSYDNQTSGLTATDVQAAIDEIAGSGTAGLRLVATSTTGNVGAQLSSLLSSFNTLSADEKLKAFVISATSPVQRFDFENAGGSFGRSSGSASEFKHVELDLANGKSYRCNITTSGATFTDISSTNVADGYYTLYVG